MRTHAIFILLIFVLIIFQTTNAQEKWTPKILGPNNKVYLPDYSYAGYKWSEEEIPNLKSTVSILKYGAKPNDEIDDTEAIIKAIKSESSKKGVKVISFPKGKFIISEIIYITQSNLVLQGAGNGKGGTILYVPRPLSKMKLTEKFKARKDYMIKNNKKVHGKYFSIFSWSGGVITIKKPATTMKPKFIKAIKGQRGQHSITFTKTSDFKEGDSLLIRWVSSKNKEMIQHVFGKGKIKIGEKVIKGVKAKQMITVTKVFKNIIETKEPLIHDIKEDWEVTLNKKIFLEHVGIENFHIQFKEKKYKGHHLEDGFNAIHANDLQHSWLRNITISHADSGLLVGNCKNISIDGLITKGRKGHYSAKIGGSSYVLVTNFSFQAYAIHNPSFNTYCTGSVYTNGKVKEGRLDQHNGCNQYNLMDNMRVDIGDYLFHHGGANYHSPTSGLFNTFWNIQIKKMNRNAPIKCHDAPGARLIGIYCKTKKIKLDYKPKPYLEGLNKSGINIPSLFEYQLKRRKEKIK
ncbi:MAG: hypothetical protein COA79_04610 [Planctomycetota bacterium]|nr:MAG: hypothetical protein COA79_04610 [Planctomycetota bacterium]